MKTKASQLLKLLVGATLVCCTIQAFADSSVKIADCSAAADANNPAESVQVYFKGGNRNDQNQYAVHYASGKIDKDFPVQSIEAVDNGATLGIQFANFLILQIHNGHSTDSKIGVALGSAPRNMTCDAKF